MSLKSLRNSDGIRDNKGKDILWLWLQGIIVFALCIVVAVAQGMLLGWGIVAEILVFIEAFAALSWLASRNKRLRLNVVMFIFLFIVLMYSGFNAYQWFWAQSVLQPAQITCLNTTEEAFAKNKDKVFQFKNSKPDLRYLSEYRHDFKNSHQYYALAPVVDEGWSSSNPINIWAFVDLKKYEAKLLEDSGCVGIVIKKPSLYHQKALDANLKKFNLLNNSNAISVEWVNPMVKIHQATVLTEYGILGVLILWTFFLGWGVLSRKNKKSNVKISKGCLRQ
jgi:hypothetical protein